MGKKLGSCFFTLGILAQQLFGQVGPSGSPSPPSGGVAVDELKILKERIALQSEQIKKLQQAVQEQQKLLEQAVAAAETVRIQPANRDSALVNASVANSAPLTL